MANAGPRQAAGRALQAACGGECGQQTGLRQRRGRGCAEQGPTDTARINLVYTRLLSPISGRIGRSIVTEGALVTANQTTALATVQQLDPIYVDVTQPTP